MMGRCWHPRVIYAFCAMVALVVPARAVTPADEPIQSDSNRGTINLDQVPKAAAQREPIGNPLWAIPLGSLSSTRDRPLLTPTRRPPAPAVVAAPRPVIAPRAVIRPPKAEPPSLQLIGTIVSETESIGVFLDQSTHNFVRLKAGEGHAGWILRSVKGRQAILQNEDRSETLSLPNPRSLSVRSQENDARE
jgi:hypothetical protein